VTVLFSDLEGRLHMLDYDKKFLIKSWDNLTFDGSSIRGFTAQRESDLRLGIDWARSTGALRCFRRRQGDGFRRSHRQGRNALTRGDIRGVLKGYADELYKKDGYTLNAANEIEGFLFKESTPSGATTKPASSST
jgi:glutamine synthetase